MLFFILFTPKSELLFQANKTSWNILASELPDKNKRITFQNSLELKEESAVHLYEQQ